jgi:lipopolysaccharide export LptBFGC system permease protein LptF
MSQLPSAEHPIQHADEHPVDFKSYLRRCIFVFIAALCAISLMVFTSYLPYGWPAKVTAILAIACFNAFVVAGFLMHLLSEKKLIYTLLGFTVFFFAGLLGLTLYAMNDFPTGTIVH